MNVGTQLSPEKGVAQGDWLKGFPEHLASVVSLEQRTSVYGAWQEVSVCVLSGHRRYPGSRFWKSVWFSPFLASLWLPGSCILMKKVYLITCTFCWVNETSNPTDHSNIYLWLIPSGEELRNSAFCGFWYLCPLILWWRGQALCVVILEITELLGGEAWTVTEPLSVPPLPVPFAHLCSCSCPVRCPSRWATPAVQSTGGITSPHISSGSCSSQSCEWSAELSSV